MVSFDSSHSILDWWRNTQTELIDLPGGGKAHKGFWLHAHALSQELSNAIDKGRRSLGNIEAPLVLGGHSLGGATAYLASLWQALPCFVESYGTPRWGDEALWIRVQNALEGYYNEVIAGDPVPALPYDSHYATIPSQIVFLNTNMLSNLQKEWHWQDLALWYLQPSVRFVKSWRYHLAYDLAETQKAENCSTKSAQID